MGGWGITGLLGVGSIGSFGYNIQRPTENGREMGVVLKREAA